MGDTKDTGGYCILKFITVPTVTMQRLISLLALLVVGASAFVSPATFIGTSRAVKVSEPVTSLDVLQPAPLQRQRKSVANVQTMGLFGLGPAEIAVILVAGAFVLGPQKLAEFGKDAGKIAGELKEVPKEFQKGLAEGEAQALAIKKEITEAPADAPAAEAAAEDAETE